jgi:hypothetical protein
MTEHRPANPRDVRIEVAEFTDKATGKVTEYRYVALEDYERLRAENERLQSAYDALLADLKQLGDPLALERLMQDAERYRRANRRSLGEALVERLRALARGQDLLGRRADYGEYWAASEEAADMIERLVEELGEAEVERLRAENERLQSAYDALLADLKKLGDPLALEKLMQDAERYRWLRKDRVVRGRYIKADESMSDALRNDDWFDERVDAFRALETK